MRERWKNSRGRYTKYKKQTKLPSGSGAKKLKHYYLADHLHFLDNFLKSRQSKGNLVTEEAIQEDEDEYHCEEEQMHEGAAEEHNHTLHSDQDTNHPTAGEKSQPSTQDSSYRKRKSTSTSLSDVNTSALKYFETKKGY